MSSLKEDKKCMNYSAVLIYMQFQGQMFMGLIIIETNSEGHTPLLSLPQAKASPGASGIMHSSYTAFIIGTVRA